MTIDDEDDSTMMMIMMMMMMPMMMMMMMMMLLLLLGAAAAAAPSRPAAAATAAVTASALGQQIEAHRQREEHNKRVADAAQQDHEKWMAVGAHVMGEEAKDKQHQRNLEILKLTKKVSEPGTQMDVKTGDVSVRATKKTRPQKIGRAHV